MDLITADWLIIAAHIAFLLLGSYYGFIKILLKPVLWIVAFIVAYWLRHGIVDMVSSQYNDYYTPMLVFAITFALLLALFNKLSDIIIITIENLGGAVFNKILGAILGFLFCMLILSFAFSSSFLYRFDFANESVLATELSDFNTYIVGDQLEQIDADGINVETDTIIEEDTIEDIVKQLKE